MSVDLAFDMMVTYPPSLAATKKAKQLPDGFVWYRFEWLEDSDIMKVVGSSTRIAKAGKNKNKLIIDKDGVNKTVYITQSEIKTAHESLEAHI